jgi:hypothetical protein
VISTNNRDCIDVDECKTAVCTQICVNTYGSYQCIELSFAFFQKGDHPSGSSVNADDLSLTSNGVITWLILLTLMFVLVMFGFVALYAKKMRCGYKMSGDDVLSHVTEEVEAVTWPDVDD